MDRLDSAAVYLLQVHSHDQGQSYTFSTLLFYHAVYTCMLGQISKGPSIGYRHIECWEKLLPHHVTCKQSQSSALLNGPIPILRSSSK